MEHLLKPGNKSALDRMVENFTPRASPWEQLYWKFFQQDPSDAIIPYPDPNYIPPNVEEYLRQTRADAPEYDPTPTQTETKPPKKNRKKSRKRKPSHSIRYYRPNGRGFKLRRAVQTSLRKKRRF